MFNLKDLNSEEARREYYTYDPTNPATMVHHSEPYLDPRFNAELLDLFGVDQHGDQRVRIVWGGTLTAPAVRHMEDGTIREYLGMKYPFMRLRVITGFKYQDSDGHQVTVSAEKYVPKGKPFGPVFDWEDLGIMKFVIEMKFTYEEMVQLGYYPKPGSKDETTYTRKKGRKFRLEPNPKGDYIFCHYIETPDGQYADVTDEWIDRIRFILNRAQTETEQEYVARKLEAREKLAALTQEQEDLRLSAAIDDARGRAESKLARGKILYG